MGTPQYVDVGGLTGSTDTGGYSSSIYPISLFLKFKLLSLMCLLPPAYVVRREVRFFTFYRCLSVNMGGTSSPFLNTSTGLMSFLGGTPVTGPRSLPRGVPKSQTGQVPDGGHPKMGYPPARDGYPQDRICLDRLCSGWYASCGFPQEDCLVFEFPLVFPHSLVSIHFVNEL